MRQTGTVDVYAARDIARAGRVPVGRVTALFDSGQVRTIDGGAFVSFDEAIRVLRAIVTGVPLDPPAAVAYDGPRFLRARHLERARAVPLAVTSSVHAALLVALIVLAWAGLESRADKAVFEEVPQARLVFLTQIGPGGGGGGGGLRQAKPAARAERKGEQHLSSPIPVRETPPAPTRLKQKPPEITPEPLPPIQAPVATVAADTQDRAGVTEDVNANAQQDAHGPGANGGAGTGNGSGLGQGDGPGIGPGEGGGTGGGPYRGGSGITPPRLLREVKPDYTEEARRRGTEGDVELEIVVRQNGSVGDVKILRGLADGLDQRAIDAVRQWRFAPAANRLGQPVDVIVSIAVEFRLR
jgi:periplasmic protein TonB